MKADACGDLLGGRDYLECLYPSAQDCWCTPAGGGAATWKCYDRHEPNFTRVIPPAPEVSKTVNELSDADRDAWCLWFSCNSSTDGYAPATAPIVMSGLALYQCAGSGIGGPYDGSAPAASVEHCKANLALSACTAPLSELTDCVTTLMRHTPSPTGCGRYIARPGCSGTIVTANEDLAGDRVGAGGHAGGPPQPGTALRCMLRVE